MKLTIVKDYLLCIDEEAEIKGLYYDDYIGKIKDSGGAEYVKADFTNKIIAYHPLTKEAKELDLPLLPPFEEDKGLEKSLNKYIKDLHSQEECIGFIEGYKAAQAKQFSLDDMETLMEESINWFNGGRDRDINDSKTFFKRYIQSLSTQQLPKEFIPEYEAGISNSPYTSNKYNKALKALKESSKIGCKLKTITNSEGKEILAGTWKY